MVYNVTFSELAEKQFNEYLGYLLYVKKNKQAAERLIEDFEETKEALASVADSLKYCTSPLLKGKGYRKIFFKRHRYLFIYQVIDRRVEVSAMYHELQDYENLFQTEC